MNILFYKGRGDYIDKLIQLTGPYSHCEIQFSNGLCFSSSGRDGGVRFKQMPESSLSKNWDILKFDCYEPFELAKSQEGLKYDWAGIIGTCLGVPIESPNRWFCSEICSTLCEAAGIYRGPKLITPSQFYRYLNEKNYYRN